MRQNWKPAPPSCQCRPVGEGGVIDVDQFGPRLPSESFDEPRLAQQERPVGKAEALVKHRLQLLQPHRNGASLSDSSFSKGRVVGQHVPLVVRQAGHEVEHNFLATPKDAHPIMDEEDGRRRYLSITELLCLDLGGSNRTVSGAGHRLRPYPDIGTTVVTTQPPFPKKLISAALSDRTTQETQKTGHPLSRLPNIGGILLREAENRHWDRRSSARDFGPAATWISPWIR